MLCALGLDAMCIGFWCFVHCVWLLCVLYLGAFDNGFVLSLFKCSEHWICKLQALGLAALCFCLGASCIGVGYSVHWI